MSDLTEEDRCPNCKAFHGIYPLEHLPPGEPCAYDPIRPCSICGQPVGCLSMGSNDICSKCDLGIESDG